MRHSLYLQLATFFVRADLRREERVSRARLRRSTREVPWGNTYLLRDIGLNVDGSALCGSEPHVVTAERYIRHLRRASRLKILT